MDPSQFPQPPVLTSDQIMAQLDALHPAAKAAALGASKIIGSQQPPAGSPPAPPNAPLATSGAAPPAETAPPPPKPIGGPKIPQGLGMPSPEMEELQSERERIAGAPLDRNDPLYHTKANTQLSGWQQIHNPIGRTAAGIGQALLGGFFPSVAMGIPGTDLHHQLLVNQNARALGQMTGERSAQARQDLEEAQAEHAHAQAIATPLEKPTNDWLELKEAVIDPAHPELGAQSAFFNKNDPTQGLRYGNASIAAKPVMREPKEGELPLGPERVAQLNQALESRHQVLNPKDQLPAQLRLPANATQKDFDRIDKLMEATERATGTQAQQQQTNEMRRQTLALSQQTRADAKQDRSYQFQTNRLDKIEKPITDTFARLSRLQDTLNQHSPQADALIAPELLSVMAGGQGSGVRMNEAEIARIVGGRSVWENLKAAMQHWSTDPKAARSITADQDRQIRALVGAVAEKLTAKRRILDEADDRLGRTNDPQEHRHILDNVKHQMSDVDAGATGGGNDMINVQIPGHPPGQIHASQKDRFLKDNPGAKVLP